MRDIAGLTAIGQLQAAIHTAFGERHRRADADFARALSAAAERQ
jgi:hypothetical protein